MKTQTITLALLLVTLSVTSCKKTDKTTLEAPITKVDSTKQDQNTSADTSENKENESYEKKEAGEVKESKENKEAGETEANERNENK